ncbi:MAG: hypothetical protein ABL908_04755 [Hyphomicrobium sp.]
MLPPRNAVLELALIVLAIVAIDWLLPDQGLSDVGPSPYWLPVLLMSLHYGTVSGLLAAGVGIAMTMLPGVPEQGVGENHFAYLLRIWAQPILWIAVAVLLGQFRIRQISAKRELVRQVRELSAQRQALADYATNLRQRCEAVEREIAGRDHAPTIELLAALSDLGRADVDLGGALARLLGLAAPGAEASVFLVDGPWLRKHADSGWPAGHIRAEELTSAHPLYRAIVDRRQSVSVLDADHESMLAGEGLAAVPIVVGAGGCGGADRRVVGMLKLDSADPNHVSSETMHALEALALALAQRLATHAIPGMRIEVAAMPGHPAKSEAGPLRGFFGRTSSWLTKSAAQPPEPADAVEPAGGGDGVVTGRPRAAR